MTVCGQKICMLMNLALQAGAPLTMLLRLPA